MSLIFCYPYVHTTTKIYRVGQLNFLFFHLIKKLSFVWIRNVYLFVISYWRYTIKLNFTYLLKLNYVGDAPIGHALNIRLVMVLIIRTGIAGVFFLISRFVPLRFFYRVLWNNRPKNWRPHPWRNCQHNPRYVASVKTR